MARKGNKFYSCTHKISAKQCVSTNKEMQQKSSLCCLSKSQWKWFVCLNLFFSQITKALVMLNIMTSSKNTETTWNPLNGTDDFSQGHFLFLVPGHNQNNTSWPKSVDTVKRYFNWQGVRFQPSLNQKGNIKADKTIFYCGNSNSSTYVENIVWSAVV